MKIKKNNKRRERINKIKKIAIGGSQRVKDPIQGKPLQIQTVQSHQKIVMKFQCTI